jgi:hypothetical protein
MSKYEVVKVDGTGADVTIYASNPTTFAWILSSVQTHEPTLDTRDEYQDIHGQVVRAKLAKYKRKDKTIFAFIISLLCENGFEPFATDYRHYDFRKEVTE